LILAGMMSVSVITTAEIIVPQGDYRPTPWPFGLEEDFPWKEIQGMWKVSSDEKNASFFSLKVIRTKQNGLRQLRIVEIDATTCKEVARGMGTEYNKVVTGHMVGASGEYRIALRAFDPESVDELEPIQGIMASSDVMVLSMYPLEEPLDSVGYHIQMAKLSNKLDMRLCQQPIKKVK